MKDGKVKKIGISKLFTKYGLHDGLVEQIIEERRKAKREPKRKRKGKRKRKRPEIITKWNKIFPEVIADFDYEFKKDLPFERITGVMTMTLGNGPARLAARLMHKQKYHAIAKRLDSEGAFFYPMEEIAEDLCVSRKTVSGWLKILKTPRPEFYDKIFVKVTSGKGYDQRNYYRLNPDVIEILTNSIERYKRNLKKKREKRYER